MKNLVFLILLIPFCSFAQNKISYKIFYNNNLEKNGLKVQVTYRSEVNSDSTIFYYSNNNWGEENLFNCLVILDKENPTISYTQDTGLNEITVRHPKTKEISLTYRIKQDYVEPNYDIVSRPRIRNNFFHILGQNLFVVPYSFTKFPSNKELDIKIDWIGFPRNFKIHNTFESQSMKQSIKTTLREGLYNSLFVGGDYRIYKFKYHDKPIYFAVRDIWHNGFSDGFLFSNLKKAVLSQRDFWKDYNQEYFTMIMTPTVSQSDSLMEGSSTTGSALRNGFMLRGTNNPFNSKDSYLYLLHHELMHVWIGGKIPYKHEELNYWFSEGFTEYYTYKNRLRIHDITFDEYINSFNKNIIEAHWKNPERNVPNFKIKDGFWKNYDIEKVPYRRGAILAFWLDNQILLKSDYTKSLDDLMRDLLEHCVKNKVRFSDDLLIDFVSSHLNKDIAYFIQKHIIYGEDIDLVNEEWIEGFEFKMTDENIPKLISTKNNEEIYILE